MEESLGGANSLVEEALKVDLDDVTGEGSDESAGIGWVNNNALKFNVLFLQYMYRTGVSFDGNFNKTMCHFK